MNSIVKLLAFIFIFTISAVRSREIEENVKFFKMKPSFSIPNPKYKGKKRNDKKRTIDCPNGMVPIQRNTKEYVANGKYWAEKHSTPLTVDSHGTHFAGVSIQDKGPYHGLAAWMSVHDLNVSNDQISYTAIYVESGVNNKVNSIQTGWMVNPSLFGDNRTWSYGFWKGANGAGCYNTICPGFVQVSTTDLLSAPFPYPGKGQGERAVYTSILQDKETRNWWTTDVKYNGPDTHIGYWPKELFDLIGNSVDIVGVTGAVRTSSSGISPPMGNGLLPTDDENASAHVKNLEIIDSEFKVQESNKYNLEKVLDNDKCYGLKDGKKYIIFKEILFTYGGPGGDSCGI